MKNAWKKWTSLLLCGCMLWLTACSGNENSSSGAGQNGGGNGANATSAGETGRYIEQVVTPGDTDEENPGFSLVQNPDGSLTCYSADLATRWDSTDGGKTWAESPGPGVGIYWTNNLALLDDGSLLAYVMTQQAVENGTFTSSLLRIAPDGTITPVEFEGLEGDGYMTALLPLDGGRVYINFNGYGADAITEETENDDETASEDEPGPDGSNSHSDGAQLAEGPSNDGEAEPSVDAGAENEPEAEDPGEEPAVYEAAEYMPVSAIFDAATGQKIKDCNSTDGYIQTAASDGANLYLMGYDGTITAFDANGSQRDFSGGFNIGGDASFLFGGLAVGGDGNLYLANQLGLYMLKDGSTETVLEGTAYAFGDPNTAVEGLAVLEDGSYLVLLYNDEGYALHRYEWDPDATLDADKIINVWALHDSTTLRAAMNVYRTRYPDGLVNLEIAIGDEGGMTVSDAVRNLNTAILGGDGPDVIILDGTPLESYISQGVLADLTDLVDTGSYYQNLLSQADTGAGTYFLPTRLTMPVLAGGSEYLASTFEELLGNIAKGNSNPASPENAFAYLPEEDRNMVAFDNLNELWDVLWKASAPAVIDGTNLDTDALAKLLAAAKTISDHYGYADLAAEESAIGGVMAFSVGASISTVEGSIMGLLFGRTLTAMFHAGDLLVFNYLLEQADSDFASMPAITDGVWNPGSLAGISASSEKQVVAGEFISMMLSDEVQGARTGDGFPVTRTGMEKQIADLKESMTLDAEEEGTEPRYIEIDVFDELVANLTTINLVDDEVSEKISEVALNYCQGAYDLDTAVNTVAQEIKNYLAERQ